MQRWIVFKQDTERKPHQMVGSVHAGDAETALLEARTVFARRPKVHSLWVAPDDAVVAMTQEQLVNFEPPLADGVAEPWHVFCKTSQRRSMTFVDWVGEVAADSAESAIQAAINSLQEDQTVWTWVVVPDRAILRSDDHDIESWFAPAETKTYKQQSQYGFVSHLRTGRGPNPLEQQSL
jgi:ring-1,2-phenylacetyl-CoA epoxidase subunit PaaB